MKRLTRIIVIMVLTVVVSGNLVFVLPKPAQAQFVVSVPNLESMSIREWIMGTLKDLLKTVLFQGLMNALNYFMQKLAYDAAVWMASGGKGQGTLFEYKNWGDYMEDVALDSAAEFIGTLSEEGEWPIDLCQPATSDVTGLLGDLTPRVTVNLQLGLADTYEPRPRCEWNQIASNWDEFISTNTSDQILAQFTNSIRPGEDGLGAALSLFEKVSSESAQREEAAVQSRQEGKGVKAVETKVSGHIETPSYIVGEQFKQKTIDEPAKGQDQKVSGSLSVSDSVLSMGLNIGSMFLNTLTSKLSSNLMGGFFDAGELISEKRSLWDLGAGTEPEGGRIAAEKIFADLLKPTFLEITNWNPLMEYTVCPPERGANNCVMDSSFAAALTEAASGNPISVREAIKKGYLRGDWPLIPSIDRSRSMDSNCYNYGYCAVNLSKLRKARIIPVGWEIAANLKINNPSSPVTLNKVIAEFNNSASDFYHLIDPNWILKMTVTQCKMKVSGPTLVSSEGDLREEVCVDTPSCLTEDENGKCLGAYGYCAREKNVWRIKADTCPAEFSSCEGLTSRDKKKVAYLRNTMDYEGCNADNVGCVWYSTEKTSSASWNSDKRIYLNKNVAECKATIAGCSDLIRKGNGAGVNLVVNSSFEKDEDENNFPDSWTGVVIGSSYNENSSNSYHGSAVARIFYKSADGDIIGQGEYRQFVNLPAGNYIVSFYAKQEAVGQNNQVNLDILSATSSALPIHLSDSRNENCVPYQTGITLSNVPGDSYERKSCVFSLDNDKEVILVVRGRGGMQGVWVDAVQLEEGTRATDYREFGYLWNVEHITMKVPPSYLGCAGGTSDNVECANYARVCAAENVGCGLFTPTNGEPPVSAKVSPEDFCPAECAGYALFRQEATNFEKENPAVYLIPKTAKTCSSEATGCAEFTDTATSAVSYYSFLRRCGTAGGANYYTWEGSDTAGYQIKSWNLLPGSPRKGETGTPPAYQSGFTDYAACAATIFRSGTNPDCREFYDEAGNISYRLYSQTIIITSECKNLRKTLANESASAQQLDCADSGGDWTAGGCLYNGYPIESDVCGKEQNGCRAYGGNASRNIFVAFEEQFESGSIADWGQTGKVTISAESLQSGGHSLKADGAMYVRKKFSNLHEGGIYTLSFWAKGPVGRRLEVLFETDGKNSVSTSFSPASNPKVTLSTEWRLYNLGPVYFDRAPTVDDYLSFKKVGSTAMTNVYFDNIVLREVSQNIYLIKNSWTIPSSCDRALTGEILPRAMVGCQEYKDLKNNLRYLKSFGGLCPENAAGCEAFVDTKNSETILEEKWNAVCKNGSVVTAEEGIDCVAGGKTYCRIQKGESRCYFKAIDEEITRNCSSVVGMAICYEESALSVPADETRYLVNDSKMYCASDEVGCVKVGKPDLKRTDANEEATAKYEDKVFKIKPSLFDSILCKKSELWCEEFKRESGGVIYAKTSLERACEYRENILINGTEQTGWFKKDTNESCSLHTYITDSGERVDDSENYRIWKNADNYYKGWVGVCEKRYSGCTTLTDPSDVSPDYLQGKPYYLIRNEELDEKSCKGKTSRAEGCALFRDLNDPAVKYRADSTYLRSRDEAGGGSVAIVSCPDDEPNCKRCEWTQVEVSGITKTILAFGYDKPCRSDSDCAGIIPPEDELTYGDATRTARGSIKMSCVALPKTANSALKNDSNLLIKVTPDRECGEWLDCRSTATVWDEAAGKFKKICAAVDLCREFKIIGENESKCVKYVEGDMNDKVLEWDIYRDRDVSWGGMDYSGYSLPNKYQIDDLKAVKVAENDIRLVKVLGVGNCAGKTNGESCNVTVVTSVSITERAQTIKAGKCYEEKCIRGIDDSIPQINLNTPKIKTTVVARTCRAYPEKTSPFPSTIAEWSRYLVEKTQGALSVKKQGYANASVCEQSVWIDGNADNIVDSGELVSQNCECSYQKAAYGRGTLVKYFSYNQEFLPEGICFGGPRDGLPCSPGVKDSCGTIEDGGTCERLTRADKYLGLEGYCVEYDYSRTINGAKDAYPCLTWRPVEIPEGGQDVYNQYQEAGYNPPTAGVGKYFCLAGKGNALGKMVLRGIRQESEISWNEFSSRINPLYNVNLPNPDNEFDLQLGSQGDGERAYVYREKFQSRPVNVGVPMNKEDIAGIVLSLTTVDGKFIDDNKRSGYKIFSDNDGNVLTRNSPHNGSFINPKTGEKYTYWETRFPDIEDNGIKNWDTGQKTYNTGHPLFIGPWYDMGNFTLGNTQLFEELNYGCIDAKNKINVSNNNGDIKNYFAIRAMFDGKDQFVGFWMSGCDASSAAEEIMSFRTEFLKAEPCIYLAQVVSDTGEQKAKTDSIWKEKNLKLDVGGKNKENSVQYAYDQIESPFGSAMNGFKRPIMSKEPWFVGREGNGSPYFTDVYFPKSAVNAGSVYSCRTGENVNLYITDPLLLTKYKIGCFSNQLDSASNEEIRRNLAYKITSNLGEAYDNLKKLFAKTYGIFVWDFNRSGAGSEAKYELISGQKSASYNEWETAEKVFVGDWDETEISGNYVRIIAPSEDNPRKADENFYAFAINKKTKGVIQGRNGNFEAIITFYGWADKDQMPIVSRWIEWGDGTPAEKYYGKYKNHKPICASSPTEAVKECGNTGLTCIENEDCPTALGECSDKGGLSFGNFSDACEEGYFEFSHTYICNENVLSKLPVCAAVEEEFGQGTCLTHPSLCNPVPCKIISNEKEVCVFRPRVRLKDNWGWCTAAMRGECDTDVSTSVDVYRAEEKFYGIITVSP